MCYRNYVLLLGQDIKLFKTFTCAINDAWCSDVARNLSTHCCLPFASLAVNCNDRL